MSDLRWTPLSKDHTHQWSALTKKVAAADGHEEYYEPELLAEMLSWGDADPQRLTRGVWAGEDLVAFTEVGARDEPRYDGLASGFIEGAVLPGWRGQGIGTAMLHWAEPVARDLVAERLPGTDYLLRASGGPDGSPSHQLLADNGYAKVRYFVDMERPLPGDPVTASDPRVRTITLDLLEETRLAHNDAFRTHWGSGPISAAKWKDFTSGSNARPDMSKVAVENGRVLAYALCTEYDAGELYVELVGTRQEAQGQGLGKAVMSQVIAEARRSSRYHKVQLDVDAENPSNAGRLYQGLGFTALRSSAAFEKREPARA